MEIVNELMLPSFHLPHS